MEIKEKLDQLGTAFEEFKKANDQRMTEIATKGVASTEVETKVGKIEKEISGLEEKIEALTKAAAAASRSGGSAEDEVEKKDMLQYKKEFEQYMRKRTPMSEKSVAIAKKLMSVDSDVDGGFFVRPEVSDKIIEKVVESNPIRELADVVTISSDSLDVYTDTEELENGGWVGETEERPETETPKVGMITIPVHEIYANPRVTQKLLDDAFFNIEQWLANKVARSFRLSEATAFLVGDGVKKPKGILSYADDDSVTGIERIETAANNAITGDFLIDIQTALLEDYQANASWLINRGMIGAIRKLKTTDGAYLWQPGLSVGVGNSLLGAPVKMASGLTGTITANTDAVIYGDFKQGYTIVDRMGIRVLRDPYTKKGFVLFYTTKRVGGGVTNGQALKIGKIKA
jgi:HK97 family phage major capsid protein